MTDRTFRLKNNIININIFYIISPDMSRAAGRAAEFFDGRKKKKALWVAKRAIMLYNEDTL